MTALEQVVRDFVTGYANFYQGVRLMDQASIELAELKGRADKADSLQKEVDRLNGVLNQIDDMTKRIDAKLDTAICNIGKMKESYESALREAREVITELILAIVKDSEENNSMSGYTGARLSEARAWVKRELGRIKENTE